MKKTILKFMMLFAVLFVSVISAKDVKAYVNIYEDTLMIRQGESVYLPQYIRSTEEVAYYWDEENEEDPVVYLSYRAGYEDELIITGNRIGTVNIYAETASGDYDSLQISVIDEPEPLNLVNGVAQSGFYEGHIEKMHKYVPTVTGPHRFLLNARIPSTIAVFDAYGQTLNYGFTSGSAYSYNGGIEVMLTAGQTYYVGVALYTDEVFSTDVYMNWATTVTITAGPVLPPSSVEMNVDASNVINQEGDHYYIFEGDTLPVTIAFSGGLFYNEESYGHGSTNSSIAVTEDTGNKAFQIKGISEGTVEVSITTTSLLKDSITVTVLGGNDVVAGDVDFDGEITALDLEKIYSVVQGKTEKTKVYDYADMNEDGVLDMEDVYYIKEMLGNPLFIDVAETDWFYDTVEYVYDNGIMTGMDELHFGPYGYLSRAQFALILYRMEGEPEFETEKSFNDITGDEWYGTAVLWAAENNIVTGYESGCFGPVDLITREQLAVMMYRYARYLDIDCSKQVELDNFEDRHEISNFAEEALMWAVGEGIITGKDNGTRLDAFGFTARAEAATIMKRFMEK